MIENVPGLAHDERFYVFRNRMEDAGYLGNQDVFNAAEYGVRNADGGSSISLGLVHECHLLNLFPTR